MKASVTDAIGILSYLEEIVYFVLCRYSVLFLLGFLEMSLKITDQNQ